MCNNRELNISINIEQFTNILFHINNNIFVNLQNYWLDNDDRKKLEKIIKTIYSSYCEKNKLNEVKDANKVRFSFTYNKKIYYILKDAFKKNINKKNDLLNTTIKKEYYDSFLKIEELIKVYLNKNKVSRFEILNL